MTLFDVARNFSQKVPLPKLICLEPYIRPYLSCVLTDAMKKSGQTLVVPEGLTVTPLAADEFARYVVELAGAPYNVYGALGAQVEAARNTDSEFARLQDVVTSGM